MSTHSSEKASKGFPVTRFLTSRGERLLDERKPISGYGLEAAAIIAAIVEGSGHIIGTIGRAIGRRRPHAA